MNYIKNTVIFGSTGSVGLNVILTLDRLNSFYYLKKYSYHHKIIGISLYGNRKIDIYKEHIDSIKDLEIVGVYNYSLYLQLKQIYNNKRFYYLNKELDSFLHYKRIDSIYNCIDGSDGLYISMKATNLGIKTFISNKESIIIGSTLLNMKNVLPIDSEISSMISTLDKRSIDLNLIKKLILPASGGNIIDSNSSLNDILTHPKWSMGINITINSTTMVNKGYELIEIMRYFNLPSEKIDVYIHPECIVHSIIQYNDGSNLYNVGGTDMKNCIFQMSILNDKFDGNINEFNPENISNITLKKPTVEQDKLIDLCKYIGDINNLLSYILVYMNEYLLTLLKNKVIKIYNFRSILIAIMNRLIDKEIFDYKLNKYDDILNAKTILDKYISSSEIKLLIK